MAGALGSLLPVGPWLAARIEAARARGRATAAFELALGTLGNATMVALLVLSVAALSSGTHNPFIYFRF